MKSMPIRNDDLSESYQRGEVWMVAFNQSFGRELRGHHPAVILSGDLYNRQRTCVIIPLTSRKPWGKRPNEEVLIHPPEGGLTKPSYVMSDQIQPADCGRLLRRMGRVSPETMFWIERRIEIVLGL